MSDERNNVTDRALCQNTTSRESLDLNLVYKRVTPSEDYFKRTMLGLEEDTDWYGLVEV